MSMVIRVLKSLFLLVSLGWGYLNISWYIFLAKAYQLMQTKTGIKSDVPATMDPENLGTLALATLTTFGPILLAVVLLFVKWPESIFRKKFSTSDKNEQF